MESKNEKEVKEAILKEVNKIAEEEVLKLGLLSYTAKRMWVAGFVGGYLCRSFNRIDKATKCQ